MLWLFADGVRSAAELVESDIVEIVSRWVGEKSFSGSDGGTSLESFPFEVCNSDR